VIFFSWKFEILKRKEVLRKNRIWGTQQWNHLLGAVGPVGGNCVGPVGGNGVGPVGGISVGIGVAK
jgi:hypothetical protein